jgi:hypothetical protein
MTPSRRAHIRACLRETQGTYMTASLPNVDILWLLDQADRLEAIRANSRRRYRQRNKKSKPDHDA